MSAIGRKLRRRGRSQEDDHSLTFDVNEFGVREPNSAEIRLAVFEKRSYRRTHRQTDIASNFQTRERVKRANSSLDQVDTKMISEIALLSQSASATQISVGNSDWLSNNWLC